MYIHQKRIPISLIFIKEKALISRFEDQQRKNHDSVDNHEFTLSYRRFQKLKGTKLHNIKVKGEKIPKVINSRNSMIFIKILVIFRVEFCMKSAHSPTNQKYYVN